MAAASDALGTVRARWAYGLGVAGAAAAPFVLLLSGGCLCSPATPTPPASVECDTASAAPITAVELGDRTAPFAASAHAERQYGGQGLGMLTFRIAVQSTGEPTCIEQRTEAGPSLFSRPLQIASHEGDWWVTEPLYVVTSLDAIPVSTTLGTLSVTRTMSITGGASTDAGADAR